MRQSSKQKIIAAAMSVLLTAGGAVSAFAAPTFSPTDPFSVPNSLITAGGRANTGYINARNQSAQQEAQQQQQAAQEAARQQAAQTTARQQAAAAQTQTSQSYIDDDDLEADPDPDNDPELYGSGSVETAEPVAATAVDDTTPEANVIKVTPVNSSVTYDEDKLYCTVYIINGFNRPIELTGKQTITLYAGDTEVGTTSQNLSRPVVVQPGKYTTVAFTFQPGQFTPDVTMKDLEIVGRCNYAWADD